MCLRCREDPLWCESFSHGVTARLAWVVLSEESTLRVSETVLKLPPGFGGAWRREASIYFISELWSSGSEFLWVCGVAMETTVLDSILGVLESAGPVCSLSWEFQSSL